MVDIDVLKNLKDHIEQMRLHHDPESDGSYWEDWDDGYIYALSTVENIINSRISALKNNS